MMNRGRTLAIGMATEAELYREMEQPQTFQDQPTISHWTRRAFVKVKREGKQGRQHFEILTGRVERARGPGEAFAIVRDLDARARQKVQAV